MTKFSAVSMSTQSLANTHKRICGEIRTNLALCEKSELITPAQLRQLETDCKKLLDRPPLYLGYLNCAVQVLKPFKKFGLVHGMSYDQKREVLGIEKPLPEQDDRLLRLGKFLNQGSINSRNSWWTFRVGEAARYYHLKGWYPYFITLTVDPKKIDPEVLWREMNMWKTYIMRLARVSAKACGVTSVENVSPPDYLAYFGTLEHGKSGHHHHGHLLVWMRNVPDTWKLDPNRHLHGKDATLRNCLPAESLWEWSDPGQSPFNFYWHADCVWQRMGHKIPVNDKTGEGLILIGPEYAGSYCSKYMKKEDKEWYHKPKNTLTLGLERLTRHLKQMTTKELIQVARWKEPDLSHLVKTMISVPDGLLRSCAKAEIYYRTYHKMPSTELIKQKPKPFKEMQQTVRDGQNPWRMHSTAFSEWLHAVLPQEANEYCEETCLSAYSKLSESFAYKRTQVRTIGAMRTK